MHSISNKSLIKSFSIYTNNFTNHHIIKHSKRYHPQQTINRNIHKTNSYKIQRTKQEENNNIPHNGQFNDKTSTSNHKHANRRKRQPRERTRPRLIKLTP